ncbi:MAG: efflux RND transporter periplasmic adaptor subunit [Nannocystaceae bacterium]
MSRALATSPSRRAPPRLRRAAARWLAAWGLLGLLGCAGAGQGDPEGGRGGHEARGDHDAPAGPHDGDGPEHEHGGLPSHVHLEPAVVVDAKIETSPARREVIASSLIATGEIQPDPALSWKVAARVGGIVESVDFREGESVTEGQVLARIRAPSLGGLRADLAALQARAASARSNLTRLEALAQRSMASQQELAAAKAEAAALDAESRAAGQRLKALGVASRGGSSSFLLRAPTAGVVTTRGIVDGQAVVAEDTVATIVNLDRAWFMARIFEHQLAKVRVGAPVEVELNGYPGEFFAGEVDFLSPQVDPGARTIVARVAIENREDRLRIGLFGTARIAVLDEGTTIPRLSVPRSAIVDVADQTAVFVQRGPGEYELHEVLLGVAAPGKVEVLRGLEEGEAVVTRGAWSLKSVLLRETIGEEHH